MAPPTIAWTKGRGRLRAGVTPLSTGAACPAFATIAAVSGRAVSPEALRGHPAVLVLHGAKNTDAPKDVARVVRAKSMDPKNPVLVTIVDLRAMAGLWRKVAEAQIKSTYQKLATKLPPGDDPADHILICPDWDGSVCAKLGAEKPDEQATLLCVGADGKVLGSFTGLTEALAALT